MTHDIDRNFEALEEAKDGEERIHYVDGDFDALEEAENSEAGKEAISEIENFIEETMTPALREAEGKKVNFNIMKAKFDWVMWIGPHGDDACYISVNMFGYFELLELLAAILDEYGISLFSEDKKLFAQ